MVGDRVMITTARLGALAELGGLQLGLFYAQDLAEMNYPDYPGDGLIACRNPDLAALAPTSPGTWIRPWPADLHR